MDHSKKVIIDCDPGHDDAIALLLAFASDKLDVQAITAVAGNQTLDKTAHNARKVLDYAGISCDVYAGYDKPLFKKLITAANVHGESGLDGTTIPEPSRKVKTKHAVTYLIEKLRESKDKITLIPTGPLTNIAAALIGAPDIKDKIEEIIFMGGATCGGNRTPAAEFNILVDPEAAQFVMNSDIPKTMIGLDVTRKAQFNKDDIKEIYGLNNPVAKMAGELLDYSVEFHLDYRGIAETPLHDPLAVATAIDESVVECKELPVKVECKGEYTTGSTVVDWSNNQWAGPKVKVALDVEEKRFKDMVKEGLASY